MVGLVRGAPKYSRRLLRREIVPETVLPLGCSTDEIGSPPEFPGGNNVTSIMSDPDEGQHITDDATPEDIDKWVNDALTYGLTAHREGVPLTEDQNDDFLGAIALHVVSKYVIEGIITPEQGGEWIDHMSATEFGVQDGIVILSVVFAEGGKRSVRYAL